MDLFPPSILPYGQVLSWTASAADVFCPYRCGRTHHKVSFQWSETMVSSVVAHCMANNIRRFRLLFPFEDDAAGLGYVLDTENMQWLTVYGSDESQSLPTNLHDRSVAYSSIAEKNLATLETSPSTSYAQAMLMLSDDPQAILESKAHAGQTPLQLASSRGGARASMFLLKNGADPNHSSPQEDPPLVLSVRNGHFRLALILLERGASPNTTANDGETILSILQKHDRGYDLKDRNLSILIDFYQAKVVEHQYSTRTQPQTHPKVLIYRGTNADSRAAAQLQVYTQTFEAPMKSQATAYAALHRGPPFAPVHALSGTKRGRHAGAASDGTLDRETWVPRVLALASGIGHAFPARESRAFWAAHAEKQLVAFFVWTHTPFAVQAGLAGRSGVDAGRVVVSAPGGAVGIGRDVVVSGRMCRDCEAFVAVVERAVGIRFRVSVAETLERAAAGDRNKPDT